MKIKPLLRGSACFGFLTLSAIYPNCANASTWFVSPQVSSLGLSGQVGYRTDYDFSVRGAWNQIDLHKSFKVDNVRYHSDIKLKSMGLLFDYFPWNNGFHFTAGIYRNDNKVRADGYLDGSIAIPIGNRTFHIDGKTLGEVNAKIEYAPIAPYLGVGYHSVTERGFSFAADLGVLYQGNARVSLEPPSRIRNINDPRINARTEQQKRDLESKANKARWYPVVSLGLTYTF